jgi:hypothetical protein
MDFQLLFCVTSGIQMRTEDSSLDVVFRLDQVMTLLANKSTTARINSMPIFEICHYISNLAKIH